MKSPKRYHVREVVLLLLSFLLVGATRAAQEVLQDVTRLDSKTLLEREMKGSETHVYQLRLKSGQFIDIEVDQRGIDLAVDLINPDGKQVNTQDSPNGRFGPESLVGIAESDGDYRIVVRAPSKTAAKATYKLSVLTLREATADDKAHVAAENAFAEAYLKLRPQRTAASRTAAITKCQEALSYFHSAHDQYREALILNLLGLLHAESSEFRKAVEYFKQALPLFRLVKDPYGETDTLNFLGGMYDVLGELQPALSNYDQALLLARDTKNQNTEAFVLNNIGKINNDLDDWQKAIDYYQQTLKVVRVNGNKRLEAITLHNIGIAYSGLGELEKTLTYLDQSLTLRRSIGDKGGEADTLTNIGSTYARLGQSEKAITFYNEALPLRLKLGDRLGEGITLDYMGVAYSSIGQPEKALEFHQRALERYRESGSRRNEGIALGNIGHVYGLLGDPQKAFDFHNQGLMVFRTLGDRENEASMLEGLARAERGRGNVEAARKFIDETLALREALRTQVTSQQLRSSYLSTRQDAYQFYIDLLMELQRQKPLGGYDGEALRISEKSRARSLAEMLNEAHADIRKGISSEVLAREREIKQLLNAKAQRQIQLKVQKANQVEIATLDKEISALEDEYQRVQIAIRQASPAYAALTQPQPLSAREIQQQLDPESVLLEYSLGEERSYLWVVSADAIKTYELPKQADIERVARQVYESLTARSLVNGLETPEQRQARITQADKQFQESATQLSQMVLAPAASEFGTKRLIVVADGVLQYVPFAALTVGSAYRPIVQDHEIVSLPSASALAVQRRNLANRKPAAKTLAVIADPVFSLNDSRLKTARSVPVRQALPANETRIIEHLSDNTTGQLTIRRLPFTRQEADQILAVAPSASNLKLLDFRANRSLVTSGELSKYRYIHFATHGYLDSSRADLSAIVLSLVDEKGNPQDGFLRALDLYNLNLPAELVVLSACETGLGKDVKGEGLVGLTRGFMYAGARRVIVSLWNVNDKATALLMERVYAGMLKTHKTPAAALRAAQIEMFKQKQWQSPYYWAGFVLQGEWK
ncbi:MAG TPA: CHAT domain-containing protein [Pyrinomonadaceae bacterium]|nr:CHAT domain-containing protein [Pyrinomonadaceae bacterium]